jgi:hypothetical protein
MSREQVAFHEAAHAVVARALGIEVASVSIIPDVTSAGRVLMRPGPKHQTILLTMAGPAAETLYVSRAPGKHEPSAIGWTTKDARTCRADIEALLGPETRPRQRAHRWSVYQAASRRLVMNSWPAIKHVAAELVRVGEIDGRRLDELIAEASK